MPTTKTESWQEDAKKRARKRKLNPLYMMLTAGGVTVGAVGEAILGPATNVEPAAPADGDGTPTPDADPNEPLAQADPQEEQEPQAEEAQEVNEEKVADSQPQNKPAGESVQREEDVDAAAAQIAQAEEIDEADHDFVSLLRVESFSVREDEFGNEIPCADVVLANGNRLILADKDGDGEYDAAYTADGYLAHLEFDGHILSPDEIAYNLARAHISRSDLEESISAGNYMAQNEHDQHLNQHDVPEDDIIDPDHPHEEHTDEAPATDAPAIAATDDINTDDLTDEELMALLAILAGDDATLSDATPAPAPVEDDDTDDDDLDIDALRDEMLAEKAAKVKPAHSDGSDTPHDDPDEDDDEDEHDDDDDDDLSLM